MNKELLLSFYYTGWELSEANEDFPTTFPSKGEKVACLLGYNDQSCGVAKENEDILTELSKILMK